ncbi:hypothetical protein A3J23_03260 [Candidatus Peregrinibacteria bacterium RIFCSPLOWO2_02_FULL_48_14]|nr:MAG: hypothetical protein A2974_01070 [Candidatus Peregrinibacteria bacterium RIFCSPLOWO2_01_FULL_48_20]OGJ45198.1 MAG: hypothetical protein A3J23_03260 [Candidatus Peregrinibacteria bacterium RIFCSPLOWO2_02_FULL_48_14]
MSQKKRSYLFTALEHYTQITMRVASITIGTMAILGVPAYFLDQKLGTWPWIFVTALIVGLPLSQYLVFKKMNEFTKNNPLN